MRDLRHLADNCVHNLGIVVPDADRQHATEGVEIFFPLVVPDPFTLAL
jgi:hypothetical protein